MKKEEKKQKDDAHYTVLYRDSLAGAGASLAYKIGNAYENQEELTSK